MAPVESNFISRDATVVTTMAHLKIVDKAFELPLVNDTYIEVSKLAQPLFLDIEALKDVTIPLVEKLTPIVEAKVFAQLLEGTTTIIQTKVEYAKGKVASAVEHLDSMACAGLDQLTVKIPALKEATPELIATTKDTVASYCVYSKEIFHLSKLVRAAEIKPVKTIGEVSVLGLNFFLSVVGLQLVPINNRLTTEEVDGGEKLVEKVEEVAEVVEEVIEKIVEGIAGVAKKIEVVIEDAVSNTEKAIEELGETVENEVVKTVDDIEITLIDAIEKVEEAVEDSVEIAVGEIIEKVEVEVQDGVENVENDVVETVENINFGKTYWDNGQINYWSL